MRIKVLVALIIGLASAAANAGGQYSGPIKPYYWYGSLYLDVTGSVQISGRPVCATRNTLRLQESDPTDPIYKNKLAMLMAAWYSGKPVTLLGTGECTVEGDEIIVVVIPG
jgi:hypothetical protein